MGEEASSAVVPRAPGRPLIARGFVEEMRRRRFVAAAAELADGFGVWEISVTLLVRVAGTARNTFYELFRSGPDCLRYSADYAYSVLFPEELFGAGGGGEGWSGRVRAATRHLYEAAAEDPSLAALLVVHARAFSGEDGKDAESGVAALAALLAARRGAGAAPTLGEEYLARGCLSLLEARLRGGDREERLLAEAADAGGRLVELIEEHAAIYSAPEAAAGTVIIGR